MGIKTARGIGLKHLSEACSSLKIVRLTADDHDVPTYCHRLTRKMIATKYVWPRMFKSIAQWAQTSLLYQCSILSRRCIPPIGKFDVPNSRFKHMYITQSDCFPSRAELLICLPALTILLVGSHSFRKNWQIFLMLSWRHKFHTLAPWSQSQVMVSWEHHFPVSRQTHWH